MSSTAILTGGTAESARQAAELAALRRMLQASRGCFSLSMVVCNSPALREYLIGELRDAFPGIEVIAVPGGTVDVFGFVREAASDPDRSALFLTGLEHSIPSSRQDQPALRSLNASRDLWEDRFPCPVVLWLPEYAATLLSIHARDFWRYRSHRFELVSDQASAAAGVLDLQSGDNRAAASLAAEEKRFRIAELEQRIAEAGAQPSPALIPHVLAWLYELAFLYWFVGDMKHARRAAQKALEMGQAVGDRRGEADAWHQLATIDLREGSYAAARDKFGKALAMRQALGDRAGEADAWHSLATIDLREGSYAAARDKFSRSLEIEQALGDRAGEAATWHQLATIDLKEGSYAAARDKFGKALAIKQAVGDRAGEAATWHQLATIDLGEGSYAAARDKFSRSLEIEQALGNRAGEAATFYQLGHLAAQMGRGAAGARLMAVCWLIESEIGHGDADSDWNSLSAQCAEVGYDQGQIQAMLEEVKEAYQRDRGRGLVEAAFPGGGAGNGVARK
jgi:tetratricopeptide (TPR) repeat protein